MKKEIEKKKQNGMSRREFVGALGVGIGSACILGTIDTTKVLASYDNLDRVILYDSTKCIGCHLCEKACKEANKLPGDVIIDENALAGIAETEPIIDSGKDLDSNTWLRVNKTWITFEDGTTKKIFRRYSCTHCGSCADVCPSKALVQRDDGIVTVNPDKCIGCHYCYQACPFDIPRYGGDGFIQKCTMCNDRVDVGREPACVEACPMDALTFGYREDIAENGRNAVSSLIKKGYSDAYLYGYIDQGLLGYSNAYLYGEEELGGLGLMYALPYSFDKYDLPELPLKEQSPITFKDLVAPVSLGTGIIAVAALAFTGINYIKNRGQNKENK